MASYLIVTCRKCDTRYNPYWGTGVKRDRCPGHLQDAAGNVIPCDQLVPGDEQAEPSSRTVSGDGELASGAVQEFADDEREIKQEPELEPPKPKTRKTKTKKVAKGK